MARQAQAQPNRGRQIGLACAGCGKPFVWLNGEPYTVGDGEAFLYHCAACGGYYHPGCGDNPPPEWKSPHEFLCSSCYDAAEPDWWNA